MTEENSYSILREVWPAEKCYLYEVLLWRAFARMPLEDIDSNEKDRRFGDYSRCSYTPPIPDEGILTRAECNYADISNDPRNRGGGVSSTGLSNWWVEFDDCVYRSKGEIFDKLRNGKLIAFGSACLVGGEEMVAKMWDENMNLLEKVEPQKIAKDNWTSDAINWQESALEGKDNAFMWVHFRTHEIVRLFPLKLPLQTESMALIGDTYYRPRNRIKQNDSKKSKVGRPPKYNWEAFYVEVARMYKQDEIHQRKDTTTVDLQNWFNKNFGKQPSYSAVSEKLKPYYGGLFKFPQ